MSEDNITEPLPDSLPLPEPASEKIRASDIQIKGIAEFLSMDKPSTSSGGADTAMKSEIPEKRLCTGSSSSTRNISSDSARPSENTSPSPGEVRLKIDLIAAKAQIVKLGAAVNRQQTIQKEMQILFEEEKNFLSEQHKRDELSLSKMKRQLELIQRDKQHLKEDFAEAVKEHGDAKTRWQEEQGKLHKQIADLKDQLLEAQVSSKGQISKMKKDMDKLKHAFDGAQSEVEILKKELARQTSRAEQCTKFRTQLEKQTFELQQVTNELKKLEFERDSYKDWEQAKTSQKRLCDMAELEKEVVHLRTTVKNLRDAVSNKLLLEEQVNHLKSRVEAMQPIQEELVQAKVKIASLEAWQSTVRAHGVQTAQALSAALESGFTIQLDAADNVSQANLQAAQLTGELAIAKFERDMATDKLKGLMDARKEQESLIQRLQKKLMLITSERESYRQQLNCYEKELVVNMGGGTGAGSAALLSTRVEQLEKALQEYRDLLAQHDQQAQLKALENLRNDVTKWREEAEKAKGEALKLRAQRDRMQTHLEKLSASQGAEEQHAQQLKVDLAAAQEEIKKLKVALQEAQNAIQSKSKEVRQLKQQLASSRIQLERMKVELTSLAQEYRDVCNLLFGYKVERIAKDNYKISSVYAESDQEYLMFKMRDEGIEMDHTEYSATVGELIALHLIQHRSVPLFLSAVTMGLLNRIVMLTED